MVAGRLALLPARNDVSTLVAKPHRRSSSPDYALDSMWDTHMIETSRSSHIRRRG
jgi:hypothetical protein